MSRRGLTLLEVLAAAVLLAVVAGTCVPLLRNALPALRAPDHQFELFELARVADSIIAEPAAFGIEAWPEIGDQWITWPDVPDRPVITVRLIRVGEPQVNHGWLAFSSGDWTIHRWIALDVDEGERGP